MTNQTKIRRIIDEHEKWLENQKTGSRIFSIGGDLKCADFSGANLSSADFSGVDLSFANFSGANLTYTLFASANLYQANFKNATMNYTVFSNARLVRAKFIKTKFMNDINFDGANLSFANFSGSAGLESAAGFMSQFETDSQGVLVYKRIKQGHTSFDIPNYWKIEENSIIEETVNPNRSDTCACGVNFGTIEWCMKNYKSADLWLCRIDFIDLSDVVVPFFSKGQARCRRLTLLRKIKNVI